MQLSTIRRVYSGESPYVTIYLESQTPSDDAAHKMRVLWEDLQRQIEKPGVTEAAIDALEHSILDAQAGEIQSNGRVLVADASGLLLDEAWDAALGAGSAAYVGEHPELGAFVREKDRSVKLIVAIADQHGAVVRHTVVSGSHDLEIRSEVDVGDDEGVHKPRGNALSHKQIQRRADEAVKHNVREAAEYIGRAAQAWSADLVVLGGEVQGRTSLRDELPVALQNKYIEIEAGGITDESAEEALAEELGRVAEQFSTEAARARSEQYGTAHANGLAVEGASRVQQALDQGAVETLLLEYDRNARNEAELLAASTRTDAETALTDNQSEDAVAAILRFPLPQSDGQ
jgi:hypothetical protein